MLNQVDPIRIPAATPAPAAVPPSEGAIQLPACVAFGATIDRQITICRRYRNPLAVLCFEIDNLMAVEQQHGQTVEHQVLCSAWARLSTGLREQDVSLYIGRGEFGVVIRNALAPVAAVVATRVAALLAEPYRVNDLEIRIAVSSGYAIRTPDSDADGSALEAAATLARLAGRGMALTAGLPSPAAAASP
jgi:diguanylate cyclase (GGDEF)-like protein